MSAIAIASWLASAGTRKWKPASGRSCWVCLTRKASYSTSECAQVSRVETRKELAEFLEPYRQNALNDHPWKQWAEAGEPGQRLPGGQSRWSAGKDLSWEPVRAELVAEVAYDHMQRDRFRHIAQFRRWRSDKKPQDCTYAQLEVVPPHELTQIFGLVG